MKTVFALPFIMLLWLSSCTPKASDALTETDLQKGKKKFPDLTMDDLIQGKKIYAAQCIQCHSLKDPGSFTEERWNKVLPKMVGMRNKEQEYINADDQVLLKKYLLTLCADS